MIEAKGSTEISLRRSSTKRARINLEADARDTWPRM
jgi:hypothetical protein